MSLNPHSFSRTALCVTMSTMILYIIVHLFSAIKPEARSQAYRHVQGVNIVIIIGAFIGAFLSCAALSALRKKRFKRVKKAGCLLTVLVTLLFALSVVNIFIAPKAAREVMAEKKWGEKDHSKEGNNEGKEGDEGDWERGDENDGENWGPDDGSDDGGFDGGSDDGSDDGGFDGGPDGGPEGTDNSKVDEGKMDMSPPDDKMDPNAGHPRLLQENNGPTHGSKTYHHPVYKGVASMNHVILFSAVFLIFLWQLTLLCGLMKTMRMAMTNPEIMDVVQPPEHEPTRLRNVEDVERGEFSNQQTPEANDRDNKGNFVRFDDVGQNENQRGI